MNSLEVINNVSEFKEGEFCIAFHKMIFENNLRSANEKQLISASRPISSFKSAIYISIGGILVYVALYAIGYFFF